MRTIRLAAYLLLAGLFLASCATTSAPGSGQSQVKSNTARIERLEAAQGGSQSLPPNVEKRFEKVDRELRDTRRAFADSKLDAETLGEMMDSLKAQVADLEKFMVRLRNRGTDVDKALENLANKLEADIRGLGDKVKEYLEK